jgi:OCT family organic cation transporter-like MFS transporter 4/5
MYTISNAFADYHCDKSWIPDMLSSLVYGGCFFGYITISIMVDNMGRKKAMLISYGIATLGMILIAIAQNIYMAAVGLFLMGYGSDSAINICFYYIT